MSKTYIIPILFCVAVIFFSQNVFGQAVSDSVSKPVFANVEDNFYTAIGPQARLFNGVNYEFFDLSIKGNGYFLDNAAWNTGTVVYDGYTYKNVPLLYDIYADQVITLAYQSALKIQLIKNRVKSFNLLGHHIINIEQDVANPSTPNPGFYDELYGGKIEVLAKRAKSIQHTNGFNGTIDSYFSPSIDYYLYKNGTYYSISSEGSFLKLLKDKKSDLQQYIRANKLKFNKQQKEQSMAQVAAYYDHITN